MLPGSYSLERGSRIAARAPIHTYLGASPTEYNGACFRVDTPRRRLCQQNRSAAGFATPAGRPAAPPASKGVPSAVSCSTPAPVSGSFAPPRPPGPARGRQDLRRRRARPNPSPRTTPREHGRPLSPRGSAAASARDVPRRPLLPGGAELLQAAGARHCGVQVGGGALPARGLLSSAQAGCLTRQEGLAWRPARGIPASGEGGCGRATRWHEPPHERRPGAQLRHLLPGLLTKSLFCFTDRTFR